MATSDSKIAAGRPASGGVVAPFARKRATTVSFEGDAGLFTQSWYPICASSAATREFVRGFDFLDGRVIVFRDAEGRAHVHSAYCPHMGADLSVGDMVDGRVRCVFHHWHYDSSGRCVALACGDPPPPTARLFEFPVVEKYGLIWAYNGLEPHYILPDLAYPESEIVYKLKSFGTVDCDPWMLAANTPDIQHIKYLHGVNIDGEDPHEAVEWTDHSMFFNFSGQHPSGQTVRHRVGIVGTNLYCQSTDFAGRWFGFVAPFTLVRPGKSLVWFMIAARRDMGTPEEIDQFIEFIFDVEVKVVVEDLINLKTIHFAPGTVTKSDKTLMRFFEYMRAFPRAHPSGPFIK